MTSAGFDSTEIGFIKPGGGSGGGVDTVNGVAPVLGDVTLSASDIPSTGPSDVQTDLDALAAALATLSGLIVIDSVAKLEAEFPNVAGVHTVNKQTVWVAQDGLPFDLTGSGNSIEMANPGTMVGLGGLKVVILGNVAGPLFFGEPVVSNMAFKNVNPAGTDVAWTSLSGRFISVTNVALLGQNAGSITNVTGQFLVSALLLGPASSGATGITFDGVNAVVLLFGAAQAPGGAAYTAFTLAPTCVVVGDVRFDNFGIFGAFAGDALLDINIAATLPTSPVPTTVIGFQVFGCTILGGAAQFKPGGIDQKDIRVLSGSNVGGATSGFIGDARADATAAPISQVYSLANTWEVVPTDNGAGVTLTINTVLTQRHSVQTVLGNLVLQYDGPEDARQAAVGYLATATRTGAAATVDAQLEYSEDGGSVWTPLPDTLDSAPLASAIPVTFEGRTILPETKVGIMLRLVSRTTVQATNTDWHTLEVSKGI